MLYRFFYANPAFCILDIEREEFKVKTQIKQLAKRQDMSGVKFVFSFSLQCAQNTQYSMCEIF